MNVDLRHGDCVELMRAMPDCSVDSVVTDPPYELGFMGKTWDGAGIAYSVEMWGEALRVLKPGGHLLAFGGTRTYHRMACAIEDAGFEIRDSIHWVYGSGFPKSLNIGKAIDKAAGAEREVVGTKRYVNGGGTSYELRMGERVEVDANVTLAATDEARRWEGWGTALKPAHEPIVVARKPLESTVAGNVLVWGTGGLNIDGCRVGIAPGDEPKAGHRTATFGTQDTVSGGDGSGGWQAAAGRWPANVVFDRTAGEALDQQSGVSVSNVRPPTGKPHLGIATTNSQSGGSVPDNTHRGHTDSGGASRFFTQADFGPDDWPFVYQAKPSRKERNAGLDGLPDKLKPYGNREAEDVPEEGDTPGSVNDKFTTRPSANNHPTVKPVALMRHLVRLVTPPEGVVLDPFAGSGTTLVAAVLEGFDAIGCEMTDEYLPIIEGRVSWAQGEVEARAANPEQPTLL
jgi:site-specific DNA-methyltransferase (adenine-specific)